MPKDTNEKEHTLKGCYGEHVAYEGLRTFLADAFQSNRDSEEAGLDERFATCIWGHAGIGKCVSGDTLVVTSEKGISKIDEFFDDGMVPDSDYSSGDMQIHTPAIDRPLKPVGFLHFAGAKQSIGIRTNYGRELIGGLQHRVKVLAESGYWFCDKLYN